MQVKLKKYQADFLYAKAEFPAMISAWGTGKTFCSISRSLIYSKGIPDNLGIIFRKTFRSLLDSTMKDFEKYTKMKIRSDRSVQLSNGSTILFRHLDEIDSINQQNINLGWFFIEQGEELESDREFFMLFGRMRRDVQPTEAFLKLGLASRSGWVIGNASDGWMKQLWKDGLLDNASLSEATTYDNANNLPEDFIKSLDTIKKIRPKIYQQYVMNDYNVTDADRAFGDFEKCICGQTEAPRLGRQYVMGVDFAKSVDNFSISIIDTFKKQLVYFLEKPKQEWNLQKEYVIRLARNYNNALVIPDSTGVGSPIVEDLQRVDLAVQPFNFTSKSKNELIEKLIVVLDQRLVTFPRIEELIEELKDFRVVVSKSGSITYSAPEGKHDDGVISLALAVWGLGARLYSPGEAYITRQPNYTFRKPVGV